MKKHFLLGMAILSIVSCGNKTIRDDGAAQTPVEISGVVVIGGTERVYANGALDGGVLANDATIGGLPLQGGCWIKLDESGRVLSGFLSGGATVGGIELPIGTGFVLGADGKIAGLKSSSPVEYAAAPGITFTPDWVFFHPNGRVSSGCLSSVYTNAATKVIARSGTVCGFYESGKLRFCTLQAEATISGIRIPAGSEVEFYENGVPKRVQLSANSRINGVLYRGSTDDPDGSLVTFFEIGKVETGYLAETTTISGMQFKQGTRVGFYRSGKLHSGTLAVNTALSGRLYISSTDIIFNEEGLVSSSN
jgi:hypothetical protein